MIFKLVDFGQMLLFSDSLRSEKALLRFSATVMVQEKSVGHWQSNKLKSPLFGHNLEFLYLAEKRFLLIFFFNRPSSIIVISSKIRKH
jgi:hypothetical protein